ncbi:LOW QUALITY PROTEIN: NDR1/HIN1-like protein 13 [Morus notabilis]|uniref:LOW QUALITY PROTEIN: NDR1/HIN1-like protein 13 n=1 Tax=Morus notabilis TaxID=981085 RepID=UPI000CED7393|nr:LOW QUALITY PROTEIN: NDR1/HIN1-like protein 13 [Morus notabilis]
MTDRVYPSAKPAVNGAGNPSFPATKAQLYSNARPAYRPQARHRRSRCCSCCLWDPRPVAFLVLILLVGLTGVAFYVIYRPQRPSFSVTSLKLSYLNVTSSSQLNSRFDLAVTARNPNKKLVYVYNPIAISIFSGDVDIGDGVIPSFVHGKKNTTLLKTRIGSDRKQLESSEASDLKASMRSRNGLPLKVKLDTKVKAKVGGLKTPRIGVRVTCDGIRVTLPTKRTAATASTSKAKCKVDIRIKIWKWTF